MGICGATCSQLAEQLADQLAGQLARQLAGQLAKQLAEQLAEQVAVRLAQQLVEQPPSLAFLRMTALIADLNMTAGMQQQWSTFLESRAPVMDDPTGREAGPGTGLSYVGTAHAGRNGGVYRWYW